MAARYSEKNHAFGNEQAESASKGLHHHLLINRLDKFYLNQKPGTT